MTRAKAKKQVKGKPTKRGLPWFAWLLIALAIAGVVVIVRIYPMGQPSPDNVGKPRAVIVDQLSSLQENEAFITEVTGELEDYGFNLKDVSPFFKGASLLFKGVSPLLKRSAPQGPWAARYFPSKTSLILTDSSFNLKGF